MPFIKSHSNYVLKSRHQDVNDGTIFERDITTIGAVDQFSPGQTPIYRSNNFIITVRNDGRPSNQYNTTKWKENEDGEIWTLQTVSGMVSDYEDDNDTKIVLKQDYYDFRDFAYYGSLTELFRASVTDIMARFPGELYVTDDHAYYTERTNVDFDRIEENKILGGNNYYYISNPFGINIYTEHLPNGVDFLKYFAEDGYKNYRIGKSKTTSTVSNNPCIDESSLEENIEWEDITKWEVIPFEPCDLCLYLNVTQLHPTIDYAGTSEPVIIATYTLNEEKINKNSIAVSKNVDWITPTLDGENQQILVSVAPNSTTRQREGEVIVTAKTANNLECTTKIKVTQDAPPPPACKCDDFNISLDTTSFDKDGGTAQINLSNIGECFDKTTIKVTSNKSWAVVNDDNSHISVEAYTEQDGTREATITITGSSKIEFAATSCTNTIMITQTGPKTLPCDCTYLTIECLDCTEDGRNGASGGRSLTRKVNNIFRSENSETTQTEESETSEELKRRVAKVTITSVDENKVEHTYDLYVYLGDNNEIVYLAKGEEYQGIHVRPKREFLDRFYNECDNFEKLLVNEDTGHKATFSVIRENEYGYYREFVPFQFPIGDGGYNLDVETYGFDSYTTQMVQIGEYYDENFTDNLWRSMTHEAIKNFDWSYTREYVEGDEQEYIFGGQRIQKALRIFAREFDEIISYINNIKNLNRITYDERSNIPDYFLTDVVENEGWDVKLVYPYDLTEYYYDESGNKIVCKEKCEEGETCPCLTSNWKEGGNSCNGQINNKFVDSSNKAYDITREFSQNASNTIKPYTKLMIGDGSENGYFIVCSGCVSTAKVSASAETVPCSGGTVTVTWTKKTTSSKDRMEIPSYCGYMGGNDKYMFVSADCDSVLPDDCALGGNGALKNRIKTYTNETEWTYQEVNNEFLRRLKINSRYIWRHKGTVEGLEMVLGMFGMKSKRWVEAQEKWVRQCKYTDSSKHLMWDYDVKEYSSFTERIEETWDVLHQNYRINWINSTKAITYDNRFMSNYNKYGVNGNILAYQGIPVAFRDAYISQSGATYEPYLTYEENSTKKFYYDEYNNKIIKRYLYPYFDKNEQLDGNPYYQMDGGWMAKTLLSMEENSDDEHPLWNFQFDVDNNIVYTNYVKKGEYHTDPESDDYGFIEDNKPLFKETVRNIRRVDDIGNLLNTPTIELHDGIICYVTRIEKNSAVIDNVVYPIRNEWYSSGDTDSGHVVSYVSFVKSEGFIKVGNSKFFDTTIIVYDVDGNEFICDIESKSDGYELKAYIKDKTFICKEDYEGNYSISNFQILDELPTEGFSNYFILDDVNYADQLSKFDEEQNDWTSGWRRLSVHDKEYLKINTIENYYKGNNPHNGNMVYDNGHEYFTYYNRLFKYASDNNLFDERCYEDYYKTLDDEIVKYGFSGLIENNEDIKQYDTFLIPDTKIHYFGNYKVNRYDLKDNSGTTKASAYTMFSYSREDDTVVSGATDYAKLSGYTIDRKIDKVWIYGDDSFRISGDTEGVGGFDYIYKPETDSVSGYNLSAFTESGWVESYDSASTKDYSNPYNPKSGYTTSATVIDEVTNQIVNNKVFDITFRLHNKWYTKEGQEELKYIDDIVLNYLTQMIPSTTILRINYILTDVVPTEIVREEKQTTTTTNDESTSDTHTATFTLNEINCGSERTVGTLEYWGKTVEIKQNAGPCCEAQGDPCDCYNCTKNELTLTPNSVTHNYKAGTETVTFKIEDLPTSNLPITKVEIASKPDFVTVSVSNQDSPNGTISIVFSEIGTEGKNGDIKVKWTVDNTTCEKTIEVKQTPYVCSCDDLTADSAFASGTKVPSTGYTDLYVIGSYTAHPCLTNLGVSTDSPSWVKNLDLRTSDKKIVATIDENTNMSQDGDRTAKITVTAKTSGEECIKYFYITQEHKSCNCQNVTITANATSSAEDIPNGGYSENTEIGTYTVSDSCMEVTGASANKDWVYDFDIEDEFITAKVRANTDTSQSRQATVTVHAKSKDGNYSCNATFEINQQKAPCDCKFINVVSTAESIPDSGYTASTEIGTYSITDSCIAVTGASANKDWVTIKSFSGGSIKATVGAYENGDTQRTATITVKDNNGCNKTFDIKQNPPECGCKDLEINCPDCT